MKGTEGSRESRSAKRNLSSAGILEIFQIR